MQFFVWSLWHCSVLPSYFYLQWFQGVSYTSMQLFKDTKSVCGFDLKAVPIELIGEALKHLIQLYSEGKIKPVIDQVYALEEVGLYLFWYLSHNFFVLSDFDNNYSKEPKSVTAFNLFTSFRADLIQSEASWKLSSTSDWFMPAWKNVN